MKRHLMLLVALASAIAAGPTATLTLEQAITIALDNDPRLSVAAAAIDQAAAMSQQADARSLPRVELAYMFQHTNNPVFVFGNLLRQGNFTAANFALEELNDPDSLSNFTPTVTLVQPIWTGGRVARGREAAELGVEAAGLQRDRVRQQVVFETVEAYSGAILAARHLAVAEEAAATAAAHVEVAEKLRAGGLVVDSDVLRARVRASEAREAVARARSGLSVATSALNFILGNDLSAPLSLPDDLDEIQVPEEDLAGLVQQAVAARPDLAALSVQEQAIAKRIESDRGTLRPEFGLSAFAESNSDSMFGHQSGNWGITVAGKFTIFDGSARSAAVDQGHAQKRQTEFQAVRLRRAIELEVTRAFYDLQAAGERVIQAETAVELARENQRIVRNRYEQGLATSVEVLDAQSALTGAQTRTVAARRDVMLGRAALDLAVGR